MKLTITIQLPDVEVETFSEHGEIDAVLFDGNDVANKSVAEFIMLIVGEHKWREKVIIAEDWTKDEPDRLGGDIF